MDDEIPMLIPNKYWNYHEEDVTYKNSYEDTKKYG